MRNIGAVPRGRATPFEGSGPVARRWVFRKPGVDLLTAVDLYKANTGLKQLAQEHPDNQLLTGRGPPGTHDVELAISVLSAVQAINDHTTRTVDLPIFDKSLHDGEGDRSSEKVKLEGPLDVFILEGWSVGFPPLSVDDLKKRYNEGVRSNEKLYFTEHTLESLSTLNGYLSDFSTKIYPILSFIIQIEPSSYDYVFKWRLEQEHAMKVKNGGRGMTDNQVHKFVERYMPGYEVWKDGVCGDKTPWAGRVLRLFYGEDREVLRVVKPGVSDATVREPTETVTEAKAAASVPCSAPTIGSARTPKSASPIPSASANPQPASAVVIASSWIPQTSPAGPSTPRKTLYATQPSSPASTNPSKPFNPTWSRKFLVGKSPLNPTYNQIPPIATLHQDSIVMKCTRHNAFFPVQGPGGRLGVHPLKKKGRMSVGGEGYLSGGVELADFAVDMFGEADRGRVALAGEDGVIRVWEVGQDGVEGPGPEPALVLQGEDGPSSIRSSLDTTPCPPHSGNQ